jgi:hypothetical protein
LYFGFTDPLQQPLAAISLEELAASLLCVTLASIPG